MPAPPGLKELIKRYEDNWKQYSSPSYKEAELRKEFLNPLFELLGWDIYNKKGRPEQYKEVVDEPSLEVEGGTKAPDYAFRLGEVTKFYVEAKKPFVKITSDPLPAFQLKRYAWSAKLPLSILTNFEDISVYDCRFKPDKSDNAIKRRILHIDFQDLEKRWDELANIFSPDAIWQGSFDKYVDIKKKGTSEVDDEILKEIEGWREELAKNIALRNPNLTIEEMNFAVQRLIDRILFLRICEDRGTEIENQLLDMLERKKKYYKHLFVIFQQADTKYNSSLFHLQYDKKRATKIDRITPFIKVDDKVIASIIWDLYYPRSPYQFDVIPADILGHVYEQFLGKVIRLTKGHRAKVEEKPEVKKAGGVYYTPTYIVNYIVENTVGKLCEGKSIDEIASIKILDPACGSGSFLIVAYKKILDEHLKWYESNKPKKFKDQVFLNQKGAWQLTLKEKKRILLNNIFGVDIDSQAVEVTKLNLLLKALEGESKESIDNIQKWFREPALPDLGTNIKCGNSLIDFNIIHHLQDLNDEERDKELARINPFNWQEEFPEIMKGGGFDAVIGNPPWGADFSCHQQSYLRKYYKVASGKNIDSYAVFVETAFNKLKSKRYLSFIIPDTFLRKDDYLSTRRLFLKDTCILELIESGPVFSKVRDTWCLVFTIYKAKPNKNNIIRHRKISRFIVSAEGRLQKFGKSDWDKETEVVQQRWINKPDLIIGYLASEKEQDIIEKMEIYPRLGELTNKFQISRGEEGSKFALQENPKGAFRMIIPDNVERYAIKDGIKISTSGLSPKKVNDFYTHPKIWLIRIQKMRWKQRIVSSLDINENSAGMKTLQIIVSKRENINDLKYLLALLSSKLMNFWCINYLADDMNKTYLKKIPIRTINFDDPKDKARHDKMVKLVERLLKLHKDQSDAKTSDQETRIKRQIDATDRQIDELVYELYDLTEDEIKIVEGVE